MQVSESGPVQSALPLLGLEEGVESRYHGASAGSESHCFPSLNEGFQPPWCSVYQLLPEKSPGWGGVDSEIMVCCNLGCVHVFCLVRESSNPNRISLGREER